MREKTHPDSKIILWGHSLGSGVAAKTGSILSTTDLQSPSAYVLEAPFSSLRDEIETRFSLPFDITQIADLKFDSNSNLKKIKEPVLILHAKDDLVRAILSCSNTQLFQDLFFPCLFLDQTTSI